MYKPLLKLDDGRLVSIWAGGSTRGTQLEYAEGMITYTPASGAGIWVDETLEESIHGGKGNTDGTNRRFLVVHEVTVLGDRCGDLELGFFSNSTRYPAVLVGKEVWREQPKEEWVDVTEECELKLRSFTDDKHNERGYWIELTHNDRVILEFGLGEPKLRDGNAYNLNQCLVTNSGKHYSDYSNFKVMKRV